MVEREDPVLAIAPQGSPAEEKEYKEGTWLGFLFGDTKQGNRDNDTENNQYIAVFSDNPVGMGWNQQQMCVAVHPNHNPTPRILNIGHYSNLITARA